MRAFKSPLSNYVSGSMKRLVSVGMDEIVIKREEKRVILGLDPERVLVPKIISDIVSSDKEFGGKGKVFLETKAFKTAKKSFEEYKNHDLLDDEEVEANDSFLKGLKEKGEMYSGIFKINEKFIEDYKEFIKFITAPESSNKKIEFTDHEDIIILEGMDFNKVMEILKKHSKKQRTRIRDAD